MTAVAFLGFGIMGRPMTVNLAVFDVVGATVTHVGPAGSGLMSALLTDEGVAEAFAAGVPIAAGVHPPVGTARKTENGYAFTGRWKTCGGVHQSSWLRLRALVEDEADSSVIGVIPQPDLRIHDTWHVLGLHGTGSYDVSVKDYFVPQQRIVSEDVRYRGGPQYRHGGVDKTACEHIGIALGIARRALRELTALAVRKGRPNHLVTDFGCLTMAIGAAKALAVSVQESIFEVLCDPDSGVTQAVLRGLAAATHVTEVALACVESAYRHSGTSGLYLPNPFERLLRDIHAASQHIAVFPGNFRGFGHDLAGANGLAA